MDEKTLGWLRTGEPGAGSLGEDGSIPSLAPREVLGTRSA